MPALSKHSFGNEDKKQLTICHNLGSEQVSRFC
jgi:hypothetical protein